MGDTCLPGLQGFPVQITGWSGFTDKISLIIPNDIHLQFSPSEIPMAFDKTTGELSFSGNNTFFMGGTQYIVKSVRISAAKQEGLASFSVPPIAEFQIWGNSSATENLAVFVIPVFKKSAESIPGERISAILSGNSVRLIDCIPQGKNTEIVKYSTCIETDRGKTVQINVAYWTSGAAITESLAKSFPSSLAPAGIPNTFGFRVLTSYVQYADEKQTKGNRKYLDLHEILQPYQSTIVLSVATAEFRNAFRIISGFETKRSDDSQDTSAYKCIAIDRSRDIVNGKIMVDPKTGKRLDEEIKDADMQLQESLEVKPSSARSIWITICIILGTLLGLGILAGLFIFFSQFIFNRKTLEQASLNIPES